MNFFLCVQFKITLNIYSRTSKLLHDSTVDKPFGMGSHSYSNPLGEFLISIQNNMGREKRLTPFPHLFLFCPHFQALSISPPTSPQGAAFSHSLCCEPHQAMVQHKTSEKFRTVVPSFYIAEIRGTKVICSVPEN